MLIISSALHYLHDGRLFSYVPYVREIDLWASLFRELVIAAPCRDSTPPPDCMAFTQPNISVRPQAETGGNTAAAKIRQIILLPALLLGLCRAMRRIDAIQVRCPGNLGLIGVLIAPLFSRYLVAKYAGQWSGYFGEPRTWKWQRALLSSKWWHGPVTVYGDWPDQPPHIYPFFNSALSDQQVERASISARRKMSGLRELNGLRVIYVGRLSEAKNINAIITAIAQLKTRGVKIELDVVGEGPERARLEKQVEMLGITDCVTFAGGVEFERVLEFYERADVLVLVSETEGWPKAIAEAMTFGLICIGSDRGLIPMMLGDGRGFIVPPGDAQAIAAAIECLLKTPGDFLEMSHRAAEWGLQYSLEGLKQAICRLLTEHWQTQIGQQKEQTLPNPHWLK